MEGLGLMGFGEVFDGFWMGFRWFLMGLDGFFLVLDVFSFLFYLMSWGCAVCLFD